MSSRTDVVRRKLALGDTSLFEKYIATRAEKKKEIVLTLVNGLEVRGWSIGLDEDWLQIVDMSDGGAFKLFSTFNILQIRDGRTFWQLSEDEKIDIEERTKFFRRACQSYTAYLQEVWEEENPDRGGKGGSSSERSNRGTIRENRSRNDRTGPVDLLPGEVQVSVRLPADNRWNKGTGSPTTPGKTLSSGRGVDDKVGVSEVRRDTDLQK